jgi:hypothetical protein
MQSLRSATTSFKQSGVNTASRQCAAGGVFDASTSGCCAGPLPQWYDFSYHFSPAETVVPAPRSHPTAGASASGS